MNLENQSSHSQNSSATTSRQGENEKTDSNMELRIQVSEDLQNKLSEYNDPKKGADNKIITFIHPDSTPGLLIELCQNK